MAHKPIDIATSLSCRGEFDLAAQCMRAMLIRGQVTKDDIEQIIEQTSALFDSGRGDLAADVMTEVVRLASGDSKTLGWLSLLYATQNRTADSLPFWEKLIAKEPDNVDVVFGMAAACCYSGKHNKAEKLMQRALELAKTEEKKSEIRSFMDSNAAFQDHAREHIASL